MGLIFLTWNGRRRVGRPTEPLDYIHKAYNGEINLYDESGGEIPVGRFGVYYVDFWRARKDNRSIAWVLNAYEQTNEYSKLFDNEGCWTDDVTRTFAKGELMRGGNLLIIDRLEILPAYRGIDISLRIMCRIIDCFGMGAGVVALHPLPLRSEAPQQQVKRIGRKWLNALDLSSFPKDQRKATKKLYCHFGEIGFRRVRDTPFMVMEIC